MDTLDIVLAILLLVAAVFLVVAVLMQSGKSHDLSGAIAGGADTFFGKTKGKTIDKMLSKVTTVVAIVFTLIVLVVYIFQDDTFVTQDSFIKDYTAGLSDETTAETTAADALIADTSAETVAETAATETEVEFVTDAESTEA